MTLLFRESEKRQEHAEAMRIVFQNELLDAVIVHWDGKSLPALDARESKEKHFLIVISYENK